jgi:hypothetical protein
MNHALYGILIASLLFAGMLLMLEVGAVRDGQALVEAAAATHPDVIISDI